MTEFALFGVADYAPSQESSAVIPESSLASVVRLRSLSNSTASVLSSISSAVLSGSGEVPQIDAVMVSATGVGFPGHIWIGGEGIRLAIGVTLDAGGGEIVAAVDDVPIFGSGATLVDALDDLRVALVEHLDTLNAVDELSDELKAQRDYLRLHLAT